MWLSAASAKLRRGVPIFAGGPDGGYVGGVPAIALNTSLPPAMPGSVRVSDPVAFGLYAARTVRDRCQTRPLRSANAVASALL